MLEQRWWRGRGWLAITGTSHLLMLALTIALVATVSAVLAGRSLLRPLVPEPGAGDFEVLVEPRTGRRPWFYGDSITLTDREIVISVRSGSGQATWNPKIRRIALADVTAVGAPRVVAGRCTCRRDRSRDPAGGVRRGRARRDRNPRTARRSCSP